ncbi:hypothetical protein BDN71DRAFT_1594547 [Pleurotus eryngii]|uniref:aspartate kinase n=1 Tax=Pleurotus eryngii TaxID=5323 RepID=A0A9P5ZFY9_PLEER|nr:hypothetical protein BDN71DRAFT_1594547 [Pleurotus eryngii]
MAVAGSLTRKDGAASPAWQDSGAGVPSGGKSPLVATILPFPGLHRHLLPSPRPRVSSTPAAAYNAVEDPALLKEPEAEIERDCEWLRGLLSAAQPSKSMRFCMPLVGCLTAHRQPGRALGLQDHDDPSQPRRRRVIRVLKDVILNDDTEGGASPVTLDPTSYDRLSIGRQDLTADPRKALTACRIPIISPEEAAESTYYGSELVHPFTVEQGEEDPIRIGNVEKPEGGGTVIHPDSDVDAVDALDTASTTLAGTRSLSVSSDERPQRKLSTAVTRHHRRAHHRPPRQLEQKVRLARLPCGDIQHVESIRGRGGLGPHERGVSARREMAIRSLVGAQMRGMVGIAIRGGGRSVPSHSLMGNVNVEMISQGASEARVPCVIGARDAVEALTLVHHPSELLADRA